MCDNELGIFENGIMQVKKAHQLTTIDFPIFLLLWNSKIYYSLRVSF